MDTEQHSRNQMTTDYTDKNLNDISFSIRVHQ
jgi:hypothetical protein